MSTETLLPPLPDIVPMDAGTQAVIDKLTTGKPIDPETYRRIRERADRIRDEIFQKHGLLDISVPSIRELRDGQ